MKKIFKFIIGSVVLVNVLICRLIYAEDAVHVKLLSWNVNSSRQIDDLSGVVKQFEHMLHAFGDFFSFSKRLSGISNVINIAKTKGATVFAFQELNDGALLLLLKDLESKGLECVKQKENPDKMSFNLLMAYEPEVFEFIESKCIYLTQSGKPEEAFDKVRNLDTNFTKSAQLVRLLHKETNQEIVFVNNHFGLENAHRLMAAEKLIESITQYQEETNSTKHPIIILGDFNSFDQNKPKYSSCPLYPLHREFIDIFREHGFKWATQKLSEEGLNTTFVFFPYDMNSFFDDEELGTLTNLKRKLDFKGIYDFHISKIEEKQIPIVTESALDHVFCKNVLDAKLTILLVEDEREVNVLPTREELQRKTIKAYRERRFYQPSDHFPIFAEISIIAGCSEL